MNLRTWWGLKYLLLLLPRHKSHINVLLLLPITHESKSGVEVVNTATFATTTYISHKRNKVYTNYHT